MGTVNNQEREKEEVAEPIRLQSSEHLTSASNPSSSHTTSEEKYKARSQVPGRMCIAKVSPAGSLFVISLAKLSIKPPPPASVMSKPTPGSSQIHLHLQRQFATMKCISGRLAKSASPICPVLTYFSIVSVFMVIVAMNNIHGSQHHHHHNLGK